LKSHELRAARVISSARNKQTPALLEEAKAGVAPLRGRVLGKMGPRRKARQRFTSRHADKSPADTHERVARAGGDLSLNPLPVPALIPSNPPEEMQHNEKTDEQSYHHSHPRMIKPSSQNGNEYNR